MLPGADCAVQLLLVDAELPSRAVAFLGGFDIATGATGLCTGCRSLCGCLGRIDPGEWLKTTRNAGGRILVVLYSASTRLIDLP